MSNKKQGETRNSRSRDKHTESEAPADGANNSNTSHNAELLDAIRDIVREELDTRLGPIENALKDIVDIKKRIDEAEASIQDTSCRLEDLTTKSLPTMAEEINTMMEGLAQQTLELDVHRRKWNLCIHGIKGVAGEPSATTRSLCVDLAKQYLQVPTADISDFSAAHRLSRSCDSGIILRFNDLSKRDAWLAGARYLKQHPDRITISPDLPPKIRPMKTELLNIRKDLPDDTKSLSRIRHLPTWPFVELIVPGNNNPLRPSMSKQDVLKDILETDPLTFK